MKHHLKCSEFFGCNEAICPVNQAKDLKSWLLSGTGCHGEKQEKLVNKIGMCLKCDVLRANIDKYSILSLFDVVNAQLEEFERNIELQQNDLIALNKEYENELSFVVENLKKIAIGDASERMSETSKLKPITKLKAAVNTTAENLEEMIGLSHEFAMGLAEHFDVLARVTRGDRNAKVTGESKVEILQLLKNMTNITLGSMYREIDERIRMEKELNEERKQLTTMFDAMGGMVYVTDPHTYEVLYMNVPAIEQWGEAVGKKCYAVLQGQESPCSFCTNEFIFGENTGTSYVWEFKNAVNGRWYRCIDRAIQWTDGRIVRFELATDINELKQMQETLQEKEHRLKTIISSVQTGIVIVNADTHIVVDTNPAAEKLIGRSRDEIVGNVCNQFMCPAERGKCPVTDLGLNLDNSERELINAAGKKIPILKTVVPVNIDGEKHFLESFVDVVKLKETEKALEGTNKVLNNALDELKKTQAQIIQSEKMASIGQLAAGVAHEINNPVGFVGSNLHTLVDYHNDIRKLITAYRDLIADLKTNENYAGTIVMDRIKTLHSMEAEIDVDFILDDAINLIEESYEGTKRIGKIVSDLKEVAHPGNDKLQSADINKCLDATLNVVWNELKYKTVVTKEYGDLPWVPCYPQQLNQVFMNLLVNAAQAIEVKGEINIETRANNGNVEIEIRDTGSGIPEKNIHKIFDPFFTTKEVGKGTGLGLHIAYNIIKKHNGNIHVESTVGVGTTFVVTLPTESGRMDGADA